MDHTTGPWALYPDETWVQILFVTFILGGGAAILAGRAIARTWRPFWHLVVYMLILAAGVRFVHFALFSAALIAPTSFAVDALLLIAAGAISWRVTRAAQMVRQYAWLYERAGPFSWRERAGGSQKSA